MERFIKVRKTDVEVELEYIGEGWGGDYDKDDPEDEPLMRFTVKYKGEELDDASYCTALQATLEHEILLFAATEILDEVYDEVMDRHSIKRLSERLSWIDKKWVEERKAQKEDL